MHIDRQDNTDLDKAIDLLDFFHSSVCFPSLAIGLYNQSDVAVFGAFGGNIGQEMANFNSLYRKQKEYKTVLVGDESIAMHLPPGLHHIRALEGLKCSILPFGSKCDSISTTGLKWNLGMLHRSMCII